MIWSETKQNENNNHAYKFPQDKSNTRLTLKSDGNESAVLYLLVELLKSLSAALEEVN